MGGAFSTDFSFSCSWGGEEGGEGEQGSLCLVVNPQESRSAFMADALADTRNPCTFPVLVRGRRPPSRAGGGLRTPCYTLGLNRVSAGGGGEASRRRSAQDGARLARRPGVQARPGDLPPLAWGRSLLSSRRAAESRPLPLGTGAGVCLRRLGRAPRVAGTVTHAAPRPRWNAHVRRGPEGTPATPRAGALDLRAQP